MSKKTAVRENKERIGTAEETAPDAGRREMLCANKKKFAESFFKSPIPMAITAVEDGHYLDVNDAFAKIMGLPREELLNNTSVSTGFITAEQRERFLEEYRRNGFVENLELPMRVKDGEIRYGLFNSSRIAVGGKTYYLTIVTDVTDRKHMEEALLLSNEIISHMSEGVVLVGMYDNAIVYANPKFEEMFGYNPGELKGKNVTILNASREKPAEEVAGEIITRLTQSGKWQGEIHNKKKDGTLFWSLASVSAFKHYLYGDVRVGVHTDITDRKRAEENMLMRERDLSNAVIDSLPGLFYVVDEELRFLRWNKNFLSITGYSEEELARMTVRDFHTEPERDNVIAEVRRTFCLGEHSAEADIILKDGTVKTFLFSAKRLHYNGKPCVVGTGFDISTRKRALEELNRFATDLEEANTALRVFMRNQGKDQQALEEKIQFNINDLVIPYLKKIGRANLDDRHKKYLDILESNLGDILSPFMTKYLSKYQNLTPQEIQIVDLIGKGKNTKEIAELLNASVNTIATHRNNIRKKLNLRNSKVNLRSHLQTFK